MRTFNPLSFLRSAPNDLLQEYFLKNSLLADFNWEACAGREVQCLLKAVLALDENFQDDIMRDFQEIHLRSRDRGFVTAIIDEAHFHGIDPDLPERFEAMRSHLERVFWIFLNRKDVYWDGAHIIWRVDKLTLANQWISRTDLPARPGPVDESVVDELRRVLVRYLTKHEARGRHCQIEPIRRGTEEIFYCYPEDYKQTVSEYVGDKLESRSVQPAFEIIFRHVDEEARVDIHVEGDAVSAKKLQVLFAKAVLKEDIDEDYNEGKPTYDLQPILSPGFDFTVPDDSGIDKVYVKLIRLRFDDGGPFKRITAEVDPTGKREAIYDLLGRTTDSIDHRLLNVDQAMFKVMFRKTPQDRRTPSRSVLITSPHTCRLRHDHRGDEIHRMLVASDIETSNTLRGTGNDGKT